MGNAFGDQKTLKQYVREQKRVVDRSIRQLEREKTSTDRDQQKLVIEIKKLAKAGQMKSAKILAKDIIRVKKHQEKTMTLVAQLRGLSLQMTTVASLHQMTESVKGVTKAMTKLNKKIELPELNKIMMEFAKQSEQLDMKQEMLGDTIENAMDDAETEEESEEVVNQVLDELGIDLVNGLADAPTNKNAVTRVQQVKKKEERKLEEVAVGAGPVAVASSKEDDDLEQRFNNLNGM